MLFVHGWVRGGVCVQVIHACVAFTYVGLEIFGFGGKGRRSSSKAAFFEEFRT